MDLTLDYINKSNKIKSQISAGVIGFKFQINGHPFDLNRATDHIINIQLSNSFEYITNIRINIKNLDSKKLMNGVFNFPTSNTIFQTLRPDIYYLEMWVDTKDGRFIFPSDGQLKLNLMSNSVDGNDNVSTIEAQKIKNEILSWNGLLDQKIQKLKDLKSNDTGLKSSIHFSNDDLNSIYKVLHQNAQINQAYFNQINQNEALLQIRNNNNATAADVYFNQNSASINDLYKTINQLKNEVAELKQNRND